MGRALLLLYCCSCKMINSISHCAILKLYPLVQYRHSIPAPVDRMSASAPLHKQPSTSINDTHTVQTFSSCTSRSDVCQCLLYKHTWITCQKISQAHQWPTKLAKQSHIQLWGHSCIHVQITGWRYIQLYHSPRKFIGCIICEVVAERRGIG